MNAIGILHSHTTLTEQHVETHPYRLAEHKRQIAQKEVTAMLEMSVTEKFHSAWRSPIVLVLKKEGSVWFCGDQVAKVNDVSQSDAGRMLPLVHDTWADTCHSMMVTVQHGQPKEVFSCMEGGAISG